MGGKCGNYHPLKKYIKGFFFGFTENCLCLKLGYVYTLNKKKLLDRETAKQLDFGVP